MGPDVWGPHGWKFLHFVSLGYPENPTENDKIKYKTFFSLIKNVLPCSLCANNYRKHLEENPLSDTILNDRDKFISWCIKMHNLVNIENNSKVYSDDEALKLILNEKKCEEPVKNNYNILLIAGIILFITIMIFYKKLKPTN